MMAVYFIQAGEDGPPGAVPIELGGGGVAWVDPADADLVNQWRWKVRRGRPGWSSYAVRTDPVRTVSGHLVYRMHRLIMDAAPGELFDHWDHDGLNNTRANLRPATTTENRINTPRRNQFGFRGVIRGPRDAGFRAKIVVDRRNLNLGTFDSPEAAARAYDEAALKFHGDFALLNFPQRAA